MRPTAPPYPPAEPAYVTQQPVYSEAPPPYTPTIQSQPGYPPYQYQGSYIPPQGYPPAQLQQSGYVAGPGQGYPGAGYPYQQQPPTEKTIIYVDESANQGRRNQDRQQDWCLLAGCSALLCCCLLD
ncbi:hypothetical protein RRG08_027337 [Elysia crispata]|uniref:Cysteine-rich transmembrane CYSTM domain-containing protein n=1 Tax=Elysia crispata TaxID=231223 RepID=A0AAE0ZQ80_9GAST|nr:hypothetical protein RRG08_027337 [Elysia crispata]